MAWIDGFHTFARNLKLERMQTVCKNIYKVSRIGYICYIQYIRFLWKTNFYLASIFFQLRSQKYEIAQRLM